MSTSPPDTVTLLSGAARLAVSPALGGAVLGYWSEDADGRHDWLVPRGSTPIAGHQQVGIAMFPLVPYSNRIRGGRFRFGGHEVNEPLRPGGTDAIHGHGRGVAWQVVEAAADRLSLAYDYEPGSWPWRYRARQIFALAQEALTLTLAIENRSREAMPAGLGYHPYFPRTPAARVTAAVSEIWLPDAGSFPTERRAPPPAMDPRSGVVPAAVALDHAFAGWRGRAVIEWPERGDRLVLTGDAELGTLIVFSPPGQDFFCVEPVSHAVDAFNLAASGMPDTGMRVLQPGETWSAAVTLAPDSASS